MLQENALTGVLFLLGVLVNSPPMFCGAVLGVTTGTVAAQGLRYPESDIRAGLYGFNAALVGVALIYFFQPVVLLWGMVAAGAALSTLLMRLMKKKFPLPAFTAPFVIVTWVMMGLASLFGIEAASHTQTIDFDDFGFLKGWGQIIFQENALSGLLFLGAIAVNSRASAVWGAVGNGVSMLVASVTGGINIDTGLAGYNGILSAIALGDEKKRWIFPLPGAALTVMIVSLWQLTGIPALTMPFVVATWIILGVRKRWPNSNTTSS